MVQEPAREVAQAEARGAGAPAQAAGGAGGVPRAPAPRARLAPALLRPLRLGPGGRLNTWPSAVQAAAENPNSNFFEGRRLVAKGGGITAFRKRNGTERR